MGVYVTTLILLNTDLTSDEPNITKDDAALFRVRCTLLFCVHGQNTELVLLLGVNGQKVLSHAARTTATKLNWVLVVADVGGPEGRAPSSHLGQNFFIFMQFLGNIGQIVCWRSPPPRGLATSSGKSLQLILKQIYLFPLFSMKPTLASIIAAFTLR